MPPGWSCTALYGQGWLSARRSGAALTMVIPHHTMIRRSSGSMKTTSAPVKSGFMPKRSRSSCA